MRLPILQEVLDHSRSPANVVKICHDILATGFKIGNERDPVTHSLEVVELQLDVDGACHRNQVQHRICGATEGHHHHHGVLKGLPGHDITGCQVELKQVPDCLPCIQASDFLFVLFSFLSTSGSGEERGTLTIPESFGCPLLGCRNYMGGSSRAPRWQRPLGEGKQEVFQNDPRDAERKQAHWCWRCTSHHRHLVLGMHVQ